MRLVAFVYISNPSDNIESKRRALQRAPGTSRRMPGHRVVDMRTQHMSVSAHIAKARCKKRNGGTGSSKQSPQITTKSFADVREVSADLETTHPARPAACQTALGQAQAPYPLP